MGKVPYMCGLMVMEVKMTTVLLMAMPLVHTQYLLELLELMGGLVGLMKSAPQRWS